MSERNFVKGYTELACILSRMPKKIIDKIPHDVKTAIKSQVDYKYIIKIDSAKLLSAHNFSTEARELLAVLLCNCLSSETEKARLMSLFELNDAKKREQLLV